jgi:hypothetical protein
VVERRRRFVPFYGPESRRLAAFFAVVYVAQGMWSLPNQALGMALEDRRVSASGIEAFFAAGTLPWLLEPAYGIRSDLVPIAGRCRVPYLVMACALGAGRALAISAPYGLEARALAAVRTPEHESHAREPGARKWVTGQL